MTVLPLYQVKKPDRNDAAAAAAGVSTGLTQDNDERLNAGQRNEGKGWSRSFWRPKASGGCCGGQNRSMWLTVGLFAFAFTFLIFIQNVAGYLAYHGYGVRYDYGIVVNDMSVGTNKRQAAALAYRWDHIPWRSCQAIELSLVDDGQGQPLAIYPPENQVKTNDLQGLLQQVSFHVPLKSRRDTTVYILTEYRDGGPTRTLDSRSSGQIINKFGFDSVESVEIQGLAATTGQQFIANIENFLMKTIKSKCERMNAPIPTNT